MRQCNQPHHIPIIGKTDCHVWWADLNDLKPRHEQLLNETERERADGYYQAHDRSRFILGCVISRIVLAAQLNMDARRVPLDRTCPKCMKPHGKPKIPYKKLNFSVTHSGQRVAVAFTANSPVGVDVEKIVHTPNIMDMAQEVLTESEQKQLDKLQSSQRLEGFLTYWTRKEAFLKATEVGLSAPLKETEVTGIGEQAQLLTYKGNIPRHVHMFNLNPGVGYVAALCVIQDSPIQISEWDAKRIL